uniref:Uncharacterized protein n=1 Tax=Magallana gigas TaxID=29159 RepID=A0A8W8HZX6_MAGGI
MQVDFTDLFKRSHLLQYTGLDFPNDSHHSYKNRRPVMKLGNFSLLCSFPYVCHQFQGDDGLYQLNCDYEVGDEYGAPDPPFFIHIGDTWRRCTCMVYGDRERSTLETFVYVCCVVVS